MDFAQELLTNLRPLFLSPQALLFCLKPGLRKSRPLPQPNCLRQNISFIKIRVIMFVQETSCCPVAGNSTFTYVTAIHVNHRNEALAGNQIKYMVCLTAVMGYLRAPNLFFFHYNLNLESKICYTTQQFVNIKDSLCSTSQIKK
jgi:hypothetical protein